MSGLVGNPAVNPTRRWLHACSMRPIRVVELRPPRESKSTIWHRRRRRADLTDHVSSFLRGLIRCGKERFVLNKPTPWASEARGILVHTFADKSGTADPVDLDPGWTHAPRQLPRRSMFILPFQCLDGKSLPRRLVLGTSRASAMKIPACNIRNRHILRGLV